MMNANVKDYNKIGGIYNPQQSHIKNHSPDPQNLKENIQF